MERQFRTYHHVTHYDRRPDNRSPSAPEGGGPTLPESREPRKERVLHTRVPHVLERELKRLSDTLRMPVSNLVRAILEDALSMADAATETVEERLRRAARHLERERDRLKRRIEPEPFAEIVAFQEVTMAVQATCALCKGDLARGSRASIGIRNGPDASSKHGRSFVCARCVSLG